MPIRIITALIALLYLPGIYLTIADLTPAPHQEDFGAYYLASQALARGDSPFDATVARGLAAAAGVEQHSPYIYPPLLALLIRPLATLPFSVAAIIWFGLSAASLLAALSLLRPVVQMPWREYRWVCAAAFFLPPVHHTLQHGQITNFLLLMIVSAALERPGGSAWAGVAAALKVFPSTLSAVYALSGRFAGFVTMVGSAAALTVGGALAEPAATADFVQRVGPQLAVERRLAPNNQSVDAVVSRWFEAQWFVEPFMHAPVAGRVISRLATAVVVGMTLWALVVVRKANDAAAQLERFALVLAATLIVSPIVWDHYYVLLLLPVAALYRGSRDRTIQLLLLVGVAFLFAHRYWPLLFAMKSPLFMSEGLAGVVVLWIALLKLLSYDRVCAATRPSLAARPSTT